MINLRKALRDYEESGALHAQIGIAEALDSHTFQTKSGHLFQMLRISGIDDECWESGQIDQTAQRLEYGLRLFDDKFRVQQYLFKSGAAPIDSRSDGQTVVRDALQSRAAYLNSKNLRQMDLFLTITYEGGRFGENGTGISSLLKQTTRLFARQLSAQRTLDDLNAELEQSRQILDQRVSSFIVQLQDAIPLRRLNKSEAFLALRRLVNFAPYKAQAPGLGYDQFVDFQLCDSAIKCHRDYLLLDDYYVKVLTLREPPTHTVAHLFRKIEELPGNFIVTNEWRRETDAKVRALIQSMRRHFHNSRMSLASSLGSEAPKPGEVLIDQGATALVADLGEAQRALEVSGHHFGEFSTTIVVYGTDLATVRQTSAEFYKVYAGVGAHISEERYNLLNAFLATIPGNSAYNLRRLWLSSANCADLSLVFSPSSGERQNEYLKAEYLAAFETRQGTPYFLNLHDGDVGHSLVLGATGSGKSFLLCFLLMQLQKYAPFTFIFDLGGSYKSLTSILGGAYLRIGPETTSVSINPFCLPKSPENLQFLYSFVRVLVESSGYRLNAQDERDLFAQIDNLYEIEPSQRRLGTLANILNHSLAEALGKWVGSGQYGKIFDNAEDTLTFARFQAFDFEGMEKVPELLEPLLFYILHRASAAVQDAANATTLKAFVIDEAWRFFRNDCIRHYIVEALKTWRKRNASVILATQSGDDLIRSEMMATVAESCPTKFFLANPGMDMAAYRETFHLNGIETETIRSLIPKREFLLKRPDFGKVLQLNVDARSRWLYTNDPYDNKRKQEAFDRYGIEKGLDILSKEEDNL